MTETKKAVGVARKRIEPSEIEPGTAVLCGRGKFAASMPPAKAQPRGGCVDAVDDERSSQFDLFQSEGFGTEENTLVSLKAMHGTSRACEYIQHRSGPTDNQTARSANKSITGDQIAVTRDPLHRVSRHDANMSRKSDGFAFPPIRMRADVAAYYAGVSETTFLDRVKSGTYPKGIREGGIRLWHRADIDQFADRQFGRMGSGASDAALDPFAARFGKAS